MKVIVTGGLGFIGSHTVYSLVQHGYEPIIIDNLCNSQLSVLTRLQELCNREIRFYNLDIRSDLDLEKVFLENKGIEAILHFAALKSVSESLEIPISYYETNISGLINICKLAEQFKIRKFIFSSSCTVYGQSKEISVKEVTPLQQPETPYGHSKLLGEQILEGISQNSYLRVVSLRYFNPIGAHPSGKIGELPNGTPQNLVPFVSQTAVGKREVLKIFGSDYPTKDGTAIRDYIHVMDLAEAHVQSIEYQNNNPQIKYDTFNIGTGKGTTVLELVETFQNVNEVKVTHELVGRRMGDITAIYADATKANTVLKWNAKRSLADALRDVWNWEKNLADN